MSPKTGLESDLGQFDLAHVSDLFCLVCLRFALGLFGVDQCRLCVSSVWPRVTLFALAHT